MNTDEIAADLRIRAQSGIGIPHGDNEFTRALLAVLDERDTLKVRLATYDGPCSPIHPEDLKTLLEKSEQCDTQAARIRELEEALSQVFEDARATAYGTGGELAYKDFEDWARWNMQALGQKEEAEGG